MTKFLVERTSDNHGTPKGELIVTTLDELLLWVLAQDSPVIVQTPDEYNADWRLEIYDDYRE
jgi:hypothetical protein